VNCCVRVKWSSRLHFISEAGRSSETFTPKYQHFIHATLMLIPQVLQGNMNCQLNQFKNLHPLSAHQTEDTSKSSAACHVPVTTRALSRYKHSRCTWHITRAPEELGACHGVKHHASCIKRMRDSLKPILFF
jgi:hypothetical protein